MTKLEIVLHMHLECLKLLILPALNAILLQVIIYLCLFTNIYKGTPSPLVNLQTSLEEYLRGPADKPFDVTTVPAAPPATDKGKSTQLNFLNGYSS